MNCKHGLKYGQCFNCDKEILEYFSVLRNNENYFFPYKLAGKNLLCLACKVNDPRALTEDTVFPLDDRAKFRIDWDQIPQNFLEQIRGTIAKLAGFDLSSKKYYNHCWGCNSDISSELDLKCQICSWFICRSCRACGCEYPLNPLQRSDQENDISGAKKKKYYPILIRIMKALGADKRHNGISEVKNKKITFEF